jgi:hypothetical protein
MIMPLPIVTVTIFEVILIRRESAHGLGGYCICQLHLFGVRTIDCPLRDFRGILERMLMQPERPIAAIRVSSKRGTFRWMRNHRIRDYVAGVFHTV